MPCELRETNAADAVDGEGKVDMLEHGEMSRLHHSFNDVLGAVGIDVESVFIGSASTSRQTHKQFGLGRKGEQRDITIRQRQ